MDIKIGQSQALTNMNSQNIELQKATSQQLQNSQNNKQDGAINQLNNKKQNISPKEIEDAVKDMNKKLDMLNSQLKIEIDKDTGIQVVKIVDKDTKEVIRQIPPEALLKVAKYLNEIAGLLFDTKA